MECRPIFIFFPRFVNLEIHRRAKMRFSLCGFGRSAKARALNGLFLAFADRRAKRIVESADRFCRRTPGGVFPEQDVFVAEVRSDEGVALDEELKDASRTGERSLADHLAGGVFNFDVIDHRDARPYNTASVSNGQVVAVPLNVGGLDDALLERDRGECTGVLAKLGQLIDK